MSPIILGKKRKKEKKEEKPPNLPKNLRPTINKNNPNKGTPHTKEPKNAKSPTPKLLGNKFIF